MGGTENLSSQSTVDLSSSESSLTGISFSSSNDAFGNTSLKKKAADMPTNSSKDEAVGIENIEVLEENQGNLIKETLMTDVEAPSKQFPKFLEPSEETSFYFKQNDASGTFENHIPKFKATRPEKTESEDLLKQRLVCLENELNIAVNNSDYWFNQCVKKREKIEDLLSNARNMNSSNFELRQEINNKSRTIYEKDQEIQRLTESRTETEKLLQKVRENLFKANEEKERLEILIKKLNEEKFRTKQTDQILQALNEKALEMLKNKNNERETSYTTHNETESDNISSRNEKGLSTVKNSENHFGRISSHNVVTRPPRTGDVSVCGNNVISKSRSLYENEGKVLFRAPMSNEPCSSQDNTMLKDPEKTKKAIREWLTEIIRLAKTKFLTERKVVSFNEGTSTDESLKRVVIKNEGAKSLLREAKISNDVPRLPKKRKKDFCTFSRVPITSEHDKQEFQKSKESTPKTCYDWNGNDKNVGNRSLASTRTDTKEGNLVKLAADVSKDTFDRTEPFADVFLTKFGSTDSVDSIDSVEPFCEVLIPWQNTEDAGIKQTIEAFKRSVTITKQHPDKTVHLGEFPLANGAESITLEEKKAPAETTGTIKESYGNIFLLSGF